MFQLPMGLRMRAKRVDILSEFVCLSQLSERGSLTEKLSLCSAVRSAF